MNIRYLHVGKGVLAFDVQKDVWRAAPLIYLWILVGKQACTTAGQEATGRGCGKRLAALCLATDMQLW